MVFGKGRAEHPKVPRQRSPDRRVAAFVAGDERLSRLEAIGIGQEARQRVADHVLRAGLGEIHLFILVPLATAGPLQVLCCSAPSRPLRSPPTPGPPPPTAHAPPPPPPSRPHHQRTPT